jgi:hypothetical protein
MIDTAYQIIENGDAYRVRITRLGSLVQEADGFVSLADAESWVAEDRRIAIMDERKEPGGSTHLRIV